MINLEKAEKILTVFDRLEDYRVAKCVLETAAGRYGGDIQITELIARLELEDAANALVEAYNAIPPQERRSK